MSKATPQDVKKLGFQSGAFGIDTETDFDTFIQEILDRNVSIVKELVGESVYNDATHLEDVKTVEVYLCAEELWRRRATRRLMSVHSDEPVTTDREDAQAKECREFAMQIVRRLNPAWAEKLSFSRLDTSHF